MVKEAKDILPILDGVVFSIEKVKKEMNVIMKIKHTKENHEQIMRKADILTMDYTMLLNVKDTLEWVLEKKSFETAKFNELMNIAAKGDGVLTNDREKDRLIKLSSIKSELEFRNNYLPWIIERNSAKPGIPIKVGVAKKLNKEKGNFNVYHWDTFEDDPEDATIFLGSADTLEEAEQWVHQEYGDDINPNGADRVDIVDKSGNVVKNFKVS